MSTYPTARNLFILLTLMTLSLSSYSQQKKKRPVPLPPPKANIVELSQDTLSLREFSSPILFQWELNADTTLKPGTVFKELIKLTYGRTEVNGDYSTKPVTLKKSKVAKEISDSKIPNTITRISYSDAEILNGIVILKGERMMSLKIFYDKNKQVSYLKDLDNGAIYWHIQSDEPPVAVPAQSTN